MKGFPHKSETFVIYSRICPDRGVDQELEQKFLAALFHTLHGSGIGYAVIRNYETLPRTVPGTDIDILISKRDYRTLSIALKKVAGQADYALWKEYPKNYDMMQISFAPKICLNPQDVVRVDFMLGGVKWLGHDVIEASYLWRNRRKYNGIWGLESSVGLGATLINALLCGSWIKEKYVSEYNLLDSAARESVDRHLTEALGKYGRKVIDRLRRGGGFKANTWTVRYYFLKTKGKLKNFVGGCLKWTNTAIHRTIYPPGMFLVFVGPDGCGKSTQCGLMKERCSRLFPGIDHFHLFPKLRIFSFLDIQSQTRWEDRHKKGSEWECRNRSYTFWKSVLRGLYLLLRFWAGYALWIYPRLVKAHLVIGERWSFDLLYDPASKGISLPYKLRKLLFLLSPKPQRVIVLRGSSEEIARRKPELPQEEIERQIRGMETVLGHDKDAKWVNSTMDINDTFKEILSALFSSPGR